MKESNQTLTVQILNKLYHVKCPEEKVEDLKQAAIYLNEKMREMSTSHKLLGLEHVAIMAALNLANETLSLKRKEVKFFNNMGNRIESLQKRIETSLTAHQEEIPL